MTTDDDARARALEENRRRSEVMAEAQHFGPPAPQTQRGGQSPPPVDEDNPGPQSLARNPANKGISDG